MFYGYYEIYVNPLKKERWLGAIFAPQKMLNSA